MKINHRITIPNPEKTARIPSISDSDAVLTKEECNAILQIMETHERLTLGLVSSGGTGDGKFRLNTDYRVVHTADILEEEMPWLYEKVSALVHRFNNEFKFDLYGLLDDILFMRYDEPTEELPASHFSWHPDLGESYTALRKFSIVIGLSDTDAYEGGEFEYFEDGVQHYGKIPQGTAVAFPAYINHRVLPITKGRRCSLVIFVIGPRFR